MEAQGYEGNRTLSPCMYVRICTLNNCYKHFNIKRETLCAWYNEFPTQVLVAKISALHASTNPYILKNLCNTVMTYIYIDYSLALSRTGLHIMLKSPAFVLAIAHNYMTCILLENHMHTQHFTSLSCLPPNRHPLLNMQFCLHGAV